MKPKAKFWHFLWKNCKKSAVNHSIKKVILINFVNLSPTFCPRLFEEIDLYLWPRPYPLILHFLKILVFEKTHLLFKLIFKATHLRKNSGIEYLSKNTILHLRVKNELGTKRYSSCCSTVFIKRFYYCWKKTVHFWGFNAFLNK